MKIRRTIYLVIGCIFVSLNLLLYVIALMKPSGLTAEDKGKPGVELGYYLGMNLFTIVGIIFLVASYRLNKKIKRKKLEDMVDSF
jgi:hypothetical protein